MPTQETENASLGATTKQVAEHASALARLEVELAGLELKRKATELGIGMGLGYAATTPAAVKWFGPHQRGLVVGLVVAGYGGAAIYISPLANFTLDPALASSEPTSASVARPICPSRCVEIVPP